MSVTAALRAKDAGSFAPAPNDDISAIAHNSLASVAPVAIEQKDMLRR
ncbi:MAG: hypothetical protein ABTD50_19375 [Polyangiaceae bacterium]